MLKPKTNIDFISITDHDTLSSFSRVSILGERYGVKVIQGVEMSAWDKERGKKYIFYVMLRKNLIDWKDYA